MKKNLTKKLMLSVLTLAFAVVSLGASTFAWFTTSPSASVDAFGGKVTANAGIQIAVGTVDGTTYKSAYAINKLTEQDVKDAINASGFREFNHLTAYNMTSKTVTPGTLYGRGSSTAATEADGYIALRFYLKADNDGKITVDVPWLVNVTPTNEMKAWNAGVSYSRTDATLDDANDDYKANESYVYDVLSAARLAIQFNDPALVDDPSTPANEAAIEEFKTFEAVTSPLSGSAYGNTVGYNKAGALEIFNKFNENSGVKQDAPECEENFAEYDEDDAKYEINISRNVEYTFDVYIWIEGFDGECTNAIFAQSMEFSLSFEFENKTSSSN